MIGEEGGYANDRGGDRVWVIDPIDGTANFLRGMPYWSVALAYVVRGRTELAVTYDPVHDELFAARRGQGASRNGRPIRVSGPHRSRPLGDRHGLHLQGVDGGLSEPGGRPDARGPRSPAPRLERADAVPYRRWPPGRLRDDLLPVPGT